MSRERPVVLTDRHIYMLADRLLYRKDIFNAEQPTRVHIPMVLTGRQRQKQADSYTVKILSLRTGRLMSRETNGLDREMEGETSRQSQSPHMYRETTGIT